MKIIKCLSEFIQEELHDSEKYVKKALDIKEEYPEVAEVLYMLSGEEMKHMQYLHKEVVKLIEEYKQKEGEPPVSMMAVYEYLHQKQIEKEREVRILQDMYKE